MRRFTVLALCLAGTAIPTAAAAQNYRFDVTDPDSTLGGQPFTPYHFFLPKAPTPGTFDSNATSFVIVGLTYGTTFSDVTVFDTFTFYNGPKASMPSFGGFDDLENIYEGPQLFTGPTNAPTFRLGSFTLDNFGSGATLVISDPNAPAGVPEPASWALMLTGFAATGWVMRRARTRVRVAFT